MKLFKTLWDMSTGILKSPAAWLMMGGILTILAIYDLPTGNTEETRSDQMSNNYNKLTSAEEAVILYKGTERPFTGKYVHNKADGTYVCKRCGTPLFKSGAKFDSGTGWPSFDDAIDGAVREVPDADGMRVEIVCANCGAHLGHVFKGEGFTAKDTRHCVNSVSLDFEPQADAAQKPANKQEAFFAGGCFWGVEYHFEDVDGVELAESGYMGGRTKNPSYHDVSYTDTGHAETVRVVYDPAKVSYEELARLFFEIHDPTQVNRQGPDRGDQYRSEIFYADEKQKEVAEKLIGQLKDKGYDVVTQLQPASNYEFYRAEDYHQDYYEKKGSRPYCHVRTPRFE